jgi:D-alanyl-D-alanine carboxypeptidase (penicillin-binding protein 5/6)
MRSSLLVRAVALSAAGLIALASPAGAALAGAQSRTPIGGRGLSRKGVDVHLSPGVPRLPRHIAASAWLVADLDTGQVLAADAPHHRWRPASTLKVLTALTLIPRLPLHRTVVATEAEAAVQGTRVGIVPRQRYTIAQLLEALLVVSGNDAALALADANGGTARTIAEMNAEARHLQADDTHAATVDGLDAPGQFSSCYDLALIARAALALPEFRHFDEIQTAEFRGTKHLHFQIQTHNPLLGVYPGTFGVKNGYTTEDDATYIGAARRGGVSLIVVLMHANPVFTPAAEALLNWGFAADGKVAPVGELVAAATRASRRGAGEPARVVPVSVRVAAHRTWDVAIAALVALVVVSVAAATGRRRWHRRRGRRRLTLPR